MDNIIELDRNDPKDHGQNRNSSFRRFDRGCSRESSVENGSNENNDPTITNDSAHQSVNDIHPTITSRADGRKDEQIDGDIGRGSGRMGNAAADGETDRMDEFHKKGTDGNIVNDSDVQDSSFIGDNIINDSEIEDSSFVGSGSEIRDSVSGRNVGNPILKIRSGTSATGGRVRGNGSGDEAGNGGNTINDSNIQDSSFNGGNGEVGGREGNGTGGGNIINDSNVQGSSFFGGNADNASADGDDVDSDNGNGGNSTASHGDNSSIINNNGNGGSTVNSINNGGNSTIVNNGGNSTIVSNGGNSTTDGQVRGNGSSSNDTTVGDNGLALVSQNIDLIPQGSSGFAVSDRDTSMDYSPGWDLLVISPHTFHAASQAGPSLRHAFNGTQIIVVGLLPPGNGSVSANYSIDGGPPQSIPLESLSGTSSPVGNTTFFTSPVLPFTNHTIDIAVTESGQGRNYSIDYLEIVFPSTHSNIGGSAANEARASKANIGAIAGAVIGAFIFVLCTGLLYWLWRRHMRRKTGSQNPDPEGVQSDEKHLEDYGIDPYIYESQLHSDGKRIMVPPVSPLRSGLSTGSSNRTNRSSNVAVRTVSILLDSETDSQTVVWTGAQDMTRLPANERKGTRRERRMSA